MLSRPNTQNFYAEITSASPEVSGSCITVSVHYPDNTSTSFIVDCGSFQERQYEKLNSSFHFDPKKVDFALITHAHIDHIGKLPFLVSEGFSGPIYCTEDTKKIMQPALNDSYRIACDNAKQNSTSMLYTKEDVSTVLDLTRGIIFSKTIQVDKNIRVTFFKNGHLFGAAVILVEISFPECKPINFIFSGDYNNKNPFYEVPALPDYVYSLPVTVFIESTYAYMNSSEVKYVFEENTQRFFYDHPSGSLVIPCFSLRIQEMLLKIRNMQKAGLLDSNIPVYVDGKLGINYTNLFLDKKLSCVDEDKYDFLPRRVHYVNRKIRLNRYISTNPQIIIASSGTGSYGPAQGYLQKMLSRDDVLFHFTGYAPEGTMARRLKDSPTDTFVKVGGILTKKNAQVEFTNEFSAHAKRDEIIGFLKPFKNIQAVFPTHGQENSKNIIGEEALLQTSAQEVGILSDKVSFRVGPDGLISSRERF